MHNTKQRRKHAFTLIELLVVIAIIAILAAILFPVFARARENARRTSCSSNIKQLAMGVMQYVQDYDERYPWMYSYYLDSDGVNHAHNWPTLIYPYVKSNQVYVCPSATGIPSNFSATSDGSIYNDSSYGLNATAFPYDRGTAMSAIPKPTQLVLICDTEKTGGNPASQALFNGNLTQRHLEGANFSFADGHVKWYRYNVLTSTEGVPGEARVYKYWLLANNDD